MAAEMYSGEARLLFWSDSGSGRTIRLELIFDNKDHPFRSYQYGPKNGQRMMISAFAIGDDEQPDLDAVHKAKKARSKKLSQDAWAKCQSPAFWTFMGESNADACAEAVRIHCGIESRSELDSNLEAARAWNQLMDEYYTQPGFVAEQRG